MRPDTNSSGWTEEDWVRAIDMIQEFRKQDEAVKTLGAPAGTVASIHLQRESDGMARVRDWTGDVWPLGDMATAEQRTMRRAAKRIGIGWWFRQMTERQKV